MKPIIINIILFYRKYSPSTGTADPTHRLDLAPRLDSRRTTGSLGSRSQKPNRNASHSETLTEITVTHSPTRQQCLGLSSVQCCSAYSTAYALQYGRTVYIHTTEVQL